MGPLQNKLTTTIYCQIAGLADCSIGHVSDVMRNLREFGKVRNTFSSCTGQDPSQETLCIYHIWSCHPPSLKKNNEIFGLTTGDYVFTCWRGPLLAHGIHESLLVTI